MLSSKELLKIAGETKPKTMEKIAAIVYTLGKTNPSIADEVVRGMSDVAEYTSEKLAQGYGPLARFGAGLAGGVATGLAGNMVGDLYDVAKRGLSKGRNFNQIMRVNPELKQFDKKRLQQSYDALHRYAPDFTADPIVGGAMLKAVAEVPGNEHVIIKDLINARKNLQDVKGSQFRMGPTQSFELPSREDIQDAEFDRLKFMTQDARTKQKMEADAAERALSSAQRDRHHQEQLAERERERGLQRGDLLAREEREAERRKQEGVDKFRRDLKLTEYREKVVRGLEPDRPRMPRRR